MAVNVDGQPDSGPQILAPAIEVDVQIPKRWIEAGAIQAHNRIVMLLDPDASMKRPALRGSKRMDINGQATDVAQVFPAHGFEDVVVAIEVVLIHHQGLECEFIQMQMLRERLGATPQPVEKRIRNEGYFLHVPRKLQTPQE